MIRTNGRWEPEAYAGAVRIEITRMADGTRGLDPATRVPTCPDWNVAQLVKHTGTIHRWAGQMVRELATERLDTRTLDLALPSDPGEYPDWLAAGADQLVAAFAATDPDAPMWAWGADQHARFWSRRMLHETTVHRVDADLAAERSPVVDERVAADGINELLVNLPRAAYFRPRVSELHGDGESIALRGTDPTDRWLITLEPDGWRWTRADGDATVTVTAPTASLLLLMYGRAIGAESIEVTGQESVLADWLARSAL